VVIRSLFEKIGSIGRLIVVGRIKRGLSVGLERHH
jgi:hypothetical protein